MSHLLQFCLRQLFSSSPPPCRNYFITFSASFYKFSYLFPHFLIFSFVFCHSQESKAPAPWAYPEMWGQDFCFALETLNFWILNLISALYQFTLRGVLISSLSPILFSFLWDLLIGKWCLSLNAELYLFESPSPITEINIKISAGDWVEDQGYFSLIEFLLVHLPKQINPAWNWIKGLHITFCIGSFNRYKIHLI